LRLDVTLADTDRARDLLLGIKGISARDAVHAAVMMNHRMEWIATFDAGFDRVSGIMRFDLSATGPSTQS
jgi:predicted nucleic acid-binding protein